jgi:hypothetical protein
VVGAGRRAVTGARRGLDLALPSSLIRGLIAYALVAVWLWVEIGRRPLVQLQRMVWLAPVVYVAVLWLMLLVPALIRGVRGSSGKSTPV